MNLIINNYYSYSQRGILKMLDRNRRIKYAPERFQESHKCFDIIISCEERVFDAVCEGKVSSYLII
jgi:RNA polymerase II subunit A C-terminal domain phosphatase SSU72